MRYNRLVAAAAIAAAVYAHDRYRRAQRVRTVVEELQKLTIDLRNYPDVNPKDWHTETRPSTSEAGQRQEHTDTRSNHYPLTHHQILTEPREYLRGYRNGLNNALKNNPTPY